MSAQQATIPGILESMGFIIVTVAGAILGWLAAIVVDRDDRVGTALCALAGTIGALVSAAAVGDVPLAAGVSPAQLAWSVLGALLAIVGTNALGMHRWMSQPGKV